MMSLQPGKPFFLTQPDTPRPPSLSSTFHCKKFVRIIAQAVCLNSLAAYHVPDPPPPTPMPTTTAPPLCRALLNFVLPHTLFLAAAPLCLDAAAARRHSPLVAPRALPNSFLCPQPKCWASQFQRCKKRLLSYLEYHQHNSSTRARRRSACSACSAARRSRATRRKHHHKPQQRQQRQRRRC